MIADKIMISPCRLIEGGIAMLAPIIRNHSNESWGARVMVPLVRRILRVWVFWYEVLARAKSADDANPWAIIMVSAACQPQRVLVIIAANRGPIWVTDL